MTRSPMNLVLRAMKNQLSSWHKGTVAEQRARQLRSSRFFRVPGQVDCHQISAKGVPSEWISSPYPNGAILLYLHGGAYALGSVDTHRALAARLALAADCSALAINYRLAPENPFPAALEDALTSYRWLLSEGYHPSKICLAGDSAGGGLAVAALLMLRDKGEPLPAGAVCFSPWFDLTLSGESMRRNRTMDPVLSRPVLEVYARYYTGENVAHNPYISPLFGDLYGLPPIHLQIGTDEVLLDDSMRFEEKARAAGVDVNLVTWQDMFHVFQLMPFLPQSREALKHAAIFVQKVTRKQS
ncbi:MAG TPA: alpha/beta hydrolase [Anaerolineaceae bacterium]|nr:alpha/beta hydrolase [Anaerolineaceae bacterium]